MPKIQGQPKHPEGGRKYGAFQMVNISLDFVAIGS